MQDHKYNFQLNNFEITLSAWKKKSSKIIKKMCLSGQMMALSTQNLGLTSHPPLHNPTLSHLPNLKFLRGVLLLILKSEAYLFPARVSFPEKTTRITRVEDNSNTNKMDH